jgi:4a-hydroxytetrahydrobiopterin dehydratase
MGDEITAQEFHDAVGAGPWVSGSEATAVFRTGTFAVGAQLVAQIADLAEAANHHPDVDLRYDTVTVRVTSHDVGGLSERDAHLARQITAATRQLGAAEL